MMRLPWHGKAVPHAVLDIIRGCNCRCRYCYNADESRLKDLAELRRELAVIRRARNVTTVTLSGGEPLLHPDLCAIVKWLHDEGLTVALLTNGVLLDEPQAAALARAGLTIVTLHIQRGQRRPDLSADTEAEVDRLRQEKARLARRHGLYPALVATVEAEDSGSFATLARFLRASDEYDYALVTVARRFAEINPAKAEADADPGVLLAALAAEGYVPSAFVGGRVRRDVPRWYILQCVQAVDGVGRERGWSKTRPGIVERLLLFGYAALCNRSVHWVRSSSALLKFRSLVNGLGGGCLAAFKLALRAVIAGWRLREKHIIVQLPPYSCGGGVVECCDDCPDATVVDGRLHPLCLGDSIKESVL